MDKCIGLPCANIFLLITTLAYTDQNSCAFRNALAVQTGTLLRILVTILMNTDVCCSYAVFFKDMIIPSKTVKMYPNNKPWVTSAVKGGLVKKRLAFQQGSLADQHVASRELKTEISKAKKCL